MAYASAYWTAPYAERVFDIDKGSLGFWIGGPSAVAGFLGVTLGGRVADLLFERDPAGRLYVLMFGLLTPVPVAYWLFTTEDMTLFFILAFVAQLLTASALGAAAATSQSLVLPRMRGVATATFFLATTLVGLALGPYLAGYVSSINDGDLSKGVIATLWITPIGFALILAAIRLVPAASESLLARAKAAGETRV
jgi:MFS family permease